MTLTPDQVQTLTEIIQLIKAKLHNFEIPTPMADSYQVHKSIANARGHLNTIDSELFSCFRLLEKFADALKPQTTTTSSRGFTVDDL